MSDEEASRAAIRRDFEREQYEQADLQTPPMPDDDLRCPNCGGPVIVFDDYSSGVSQLDCEICGWSDTEDLYGTENDDDA